MFVAILEGMDENVPKWSSAGQWGQCTGVRPVRRSLVRVSFVAFLCHCFTRCGWGCPVWWWSWWRRTPRWQLGLIGDHGVWKGVLTRYTHNHEMGFKLLVLNCMQLCILTVYIVGQVSLHNKIYISSKIRLDHWATCLGKYGPNQVHCLK